MKRIGLLVLVFLVVPAPTAQGAHDPVGSGATKLALDPGFLALTKKHGVKLRAIAPARMKGGTVTFPVAGGKFDPTKGVGAIEHDGELRFEAGGRRVRIRNLQLKTTQRRNPFTAKVGGSQLKLARAADLEVARKGFGETISARGLTLSPKLATRLAKKLRLRGVFQAGQPLASALTTADPQTIKLLAEGRVSLALDPAFTAKLNSLFVAVNPIFPAEHPGEFTLPVAKGTLAPDGGEGTVSTGGALEFLQQGGGQVFWAESELDLGGGIFSADAEVRPSPPYGGKIGRIGIAGLSLAGAAISSRPSDRTLSVVGGQLSLGAETAATFNEVFAKPQERDGVFAAGETMGTVSLLVQGQ